MFKRLAFLLFTTFALTAGAALADNPTPAKGPFAAAVHAVANLTYKDGSQQSWTWDRGRITAVSASSITLTRRDKQQVTFAITADTAVRNDGATYGLSDLTVGLAATVISQNGSAVIIRHLRGHGAPAGADPSAIDGPIVKSVTGTVDTLYADASTQSFEFDRGLITAAGNGQLTLKRPDGKSVSFTYDASTCVRDCKGQLESTDNLTAGEAAIFFSQGGALELAGCLRQPQHQHGQGEGQGKARRGAGAPATT